MNACATQVCDEALESNMNTTNKITVFLLDDHDVVRTSVAQMLDAEPDMQVVGESATAAGALQVVASTHPRVAVLDVRLKDGNGFEVCRDIRATHSDVRCLMLTSFSDDRSIVDAALAGADGVVLKQIRGNGIVRSIREVASGHVLLDSATVSIAMDRLRATQRLSIAALSDRESQLFEMIGRGDSDAQIALINNRSAATVRQEVAALLRKLGMARRIEANEAFRRRQHAGNETHDTERGGLLP